MRVKREIMNGDKQSIWRELQGLRQCLGTRTLRKILYMILFQPKREVYSTSKRKITNLCVVHKSSAALSIPFFSVTSEKMSLLLAKKNPSM